MSGANDYDILRQVEALLSGSSGSVPDMEPLAQAMRDYYDELRAKGFSERQAFELVKLFQAACVAVHGRSGI